eukprot:scaffold151558_cov26-Tisochrysis_lutea.AAC.3
MPAPCATSRPWRLGLSAVRASSRASRAAIASADSLGGVVRREAALLPPPTDMPIPPTPDPPTPIAPAPTFSVRLEPPPAPPPFPPSGSTRPTRGPPPKR